MPFFEVAAERLVEYHRALDSRGGARNGAPEPAQGAEDLLEEAYARLSQMDYLVDEIGRREEEHRSLNERQLRRAQIIGESNRLAGLASAPPTDWQLVFPVGETERKDAIAFEIELFTEAFYWIAARLRTVIRLLPELRGFEAVGVRDTRNKLVEHPERIHSLLVPRSLTYGGDRGPVLKPSRAAAVTSLFPDAGLRPNAEEFRDALSAALDRALSRLTPRPSA